MKHPKPPERQLKRSAALAARHHGWSGLRQLHGRAGVSPVIPYGLVDEALPAHAAWKAALRHSTGAGCRTRTDDLIITNELLYQLS